jgi:hypothetical protein
MADNTLPEDPELEAGDFSAWLADMQAAIRGDGGSTVPCAGCTACCTASQFVHIGPDERDTLDHIPAELLFPAPGLPAGHVVLGYDQRGHCPLLIDNQCSVYEHRPQACRTYDCRVFSATGVVLRGSRTSLIARRVRRWRFSFPNRSDVIDHEATRTPQLIPMRAPTRMTPARSRRPPRPFTRRSRAAWDVAQHAEGTGLALAPDTSTRDGRAQWTASSPVARSLTYVTDKTRAVEVGGWSGPWEDDDPDANFKADVALYSHVDPMATIGNLAAAMDVPEGAVVHYVLAKWASAGSGGLLELGPSMVHRLWAVVERSEAEDTDAARLAGYDQLRQMISWLRLPLVDDGDDAGY